MQHGLNGRLQLGNYFNTRSKIRRYRRDYAVKNIALAPAILSVAGKIRPEFLRFLWVVADMQTVKCFDVVGDEEDIGSERFKWSRASTFSYNRNAISLAVAYASVMCTHLSVHGTANPMSAASVCPQSAADCPIRGAVDISRHTCLPYELAVYVSNLHSRMLDPKASNCFHLWLRCIY